MKLFLFIFVGVVLIASCSFNYVGGDFSPVNKITINLDSEAENFLKINTHVAMDYRAFKEIMKKSRGFISAFWCEGTVCEGKIKEETRASTRCVPLDVKEESGPCIACGNPAEHRWYFAQSY